MKNKSTILEDIINRLFVILLGTKVRVLLPILDQLTVDESQNENDAEETILRGTFYSVGSTYKISKLS